MCDISPHAAKHLHCNIYHHIHVSKICHIITYLSVQCMTPPHTCQYNVQHLHIPVSTIYNTTTYLSLQCTTPPHTCKYNVWHHHILASIMYDTTTYMSVHCVATPHTCQNNVRHHHIPISRMYDTTTYVSVLCMTTPHTCQYNEWQHHIPVSLTDNKQRTEAVWRCVIVSGVQVMTSIMATWPPPVPTHSVRSSCSTIAVMRPSFFGNLEQAHFPSTFALQGHKTGVFHQHSHFKVTRQAFPIHIHTPRSQDRHFPFTLKVTRQALSKSLEAVMLCVCSRVLWELTQTVSWCPGRPWGGHVVSLQ